MTISGSYAGKIINLATITSDADEDTAYFKLELNEKFDITKLLKEKYGPEKNLLENPSWIATENFSEVVFAKSGKHRVVVMSSPNFATHNGGEIHLDLLLEGHLIAKDERWPEPYILQLVRVGDSWLLKKDGVKVTHLYFKSNRKLGKVVGIKEVLINKVRTPKN